ncbi:MAG: hypothetical protein J0I79_09210 [Mesorhizobium sp.]|uniref:hypothetical protein n=1 Tax=Mesorhizobium sp. TaxID=1871066 RepID=UPI001ACCAB59|nr:hypothetical protein [Mesorhizobium sp.]MBN9218119.1 hypothetical protein [Mesorhizobium sp.]
MTRAKVDTQRDERAKRESEIVIAAERAAREEKTARLRALRLAAQTADRPAPASPGAAPHKSSSRD